MSDDIRRSRPGAIQDSGRDAIRYSRRGAIQLIGASALASLAGGIAPVARAGASPAASAAERLRALIEASEAAAQRLEPIPRNASARAPDDPAFVDPLSDAYFAALRSNVRRDWSALREIDRTALPAVDRLAYDVFRYRTVRQIERLRSGRWKVQRSVPLNASSGLHVQLADYVSGGGAPFATPADYEQGLQRLFGFSAYLGSTVSRLREGAGAGYLQPRLVVEHVLGQVDAFLGLPVERTPFYAALLRVPESIGAAERTRLEGAYREAISSSVLPAYARLRDYLRGTYLKRANEAPGRWALKDGDELYAAELQQHTTMLTTAAALHETGLAEVERYRSSMEAVRRDLAFGGDLAAFFEHVRSDPKFYFTRPEDLIARFEEIEGRIWKGIPRLFARSPRAPFEVRALPGVGGQRGTGYYRPGPPDGVAPGVLFFNMEMLGTRPIPTLETLTLHEGIPGHHFQNTLVLEDATLPSILRYGGLTAYVEGWGLYAESLGRDLGMFEDPWQWFGHLDMGMLRAVRLVVDTGLHAMQWSRQRAIDYMLANTSMAVRDVAVEIDRYISWPGQACAYKPGELKIRELRERAARRLGGRFDVREFHAQVLHTGALPLDVLEAKIDDWLAAAS